MWTYYSRMIISLPDVNVWIALAAEGHVHHVAARDWFAAQPAASVAFCRITQMGLLRLLTNSSVMGRGPRTIVQAWDTFAQLRADRRSVFAIEPDGVESACRLPSVPRRRQQRQGVGHDADLGRQAPRKLAIDLDINTAVLGVG